jgi:hypothetical protein
MLRILTEQFDGARVGADQSKQQADGGGFPGAVGAQQRQQFAAVNLQLRAIERGEFAVGLDRAVKAGDRAVGDGRAGRWQAVWRHG